MSSSALPPAIRGELARGEAIECRVVELGELHIVLTGFIPDGTEDGDLLRLLARFAEFAGRVEALADQ